MTDRSALGLVEKKKDVLRELDSYRAASRQAFDEGYAAARADVPIQAAWERSEARQTEWAFAHTRMSVWALLTAEDDARESQREAHKRA